MKTYLRVSLGITAIMLLFCLVSDAAFGTQYIAEETLFQPFPHLILFGSMIYDLVFWYRRRKEKRETAMTRTPPRKTPLDYIILWTAVCLTAATSALFLGWLAGILLP